MHFPAASETTSDFFPVTRVRFWANELIHWSDSLSSDWSAFVLLHAFRARYHIDFRSFSAAGKSQKHRGHQRQYKSVFHILLLIKLLIYAFISFATNSKSPPTESAPIPQLQAPADNVPSAPPDSPRNTPAKGPCAAGVSALRTMPMKFQC